MLTRSWLAHWPHAEAVGSHGAGREGCGARCRMSVCVHPIPHVCVTHLYVYSNGLETDIPGWPQGKWEGVYGYSCVWR